MKTGTALFIASTSNTTVTYTTPFPNATIAVYCTVIDGNSSNNTTRFTLTNMTASYFKMFAWDNGYTSGLWMAFGF